MPELESFPTEVLVVDDEEVVLELFELLFEANGIPMRTASRGDEAIELLRKCRFGCVLTDKNLPGADGIEVIRAARSEQPWCRCILMTAYASTGSAIEALRLGATDYVEKPFSDLDALVTEIQDALRQGEADLQRDALLRHLRASAEQLPDCDPGALQPANLAMFERVVESRVARATDDLRCRCESLEARLQQVGALQAGAEALVQHLRAAGSAAGPGVAPDAVDRLARALDQLAREPGAGASQPR